MKLSKFIFLLIALVLTACSFSLAEDITPPPGSEQVLLSSPQPVEISGPLYPLVPTNPENGEAIYTEKCAPCHGEKGRGDGPRAAQLPNPVSPIGSPDYARGFTPAKWYTQVTQGNLEKFMPPFNSLSDRQRWDVVAYSFTLGAPSAVVEQGAELYRANCERCHGIKGLGDGPDLASLSTSPIDLTNQAFMADKSAADFYHAMAMGVSSDMPAFGDQLSEDELWALAAYLRTMTFVAHEDEPMAVDTSPFPETTAESQAIDVPATPSVDISQDMGTISGVVNNASSGEVPIDQAVTLHGLDHMQTIITETTTVQSDGAFLFKDVDTSPELAYVVTIDYGQTTYGSDIGIFQEDIFALNLPLEIFETTTDASILTADRLHLFFEFVDDETVRVIELYILSNPTDNTLVAAGEGQTTVNFALPEEATHLEIQDGAIGGRFLETPGGFGDTIPIRPGSGVYEILYAYEMPYKRKLDLVHPMLYPVDAVVILIPEDGVKVKSQMLRDDGTRDVQGMLYHLYSGGGLNTNDDLRLTLSGRPSGSNLSIISGSSTGLIIGLGVFGVALILSGVWLFSRTRTAKVEDEDVEEQVSETKLDSGTENVDTYMDAIIALDDLYQAGQLPEDAYQERRAELKARLKESMEN